MDALVTALAKAQSEFPTIAKSHSAEVTMKSGGKYKYTYANLADTLAAVVPVLTANGIALLQPIVTTATGVEIQTVLLGHGERITSSMPLDVARLAPQEIGSLVSYYRRYLLTSLLALAVDDDDGKAATTARRKPAARTAAPVTLGEEHKQAFRDWFDGLPDEVQVERKASFKSTFGKLDDVALGRWSEVEAWMASA